MKVLSSPFSPSQAVPKAQAGQFNQAFQQQSSVDTLAIRQLRFQGETPDFPVELIRDIVKAPVISYNLQKAQYYDLDEDRTLITHTPIALALDKEKSPFLIISWTFIDDKNDIHYWENSAGAPESLKDEMNTKLQAPRGRCYLLIKDGLRVIVSDEPLQMRVIERRKKRELYNAQNLTPEQVKVIQALYEVLDETEIEARQIITTGPEPDKIISTLHKQQEEGAVQSKKDKLLQLLDSL